MDRTSDWYEFLETQLEYAEKARDWATLNTLDEDGWLPLHHALKSNVDLGTTKLLMTGNPSAFWTVDKKKLALQYTLLVSSDRRKLSNTWWKL